MIKETIFVSVASYRDPDCCNTVKDIFEKASDPSRVFLGICQQNDKENDIDAVINAKEYEKNIKIMRLHYKDARGPTFARFLCSTFYNDETYFFQIDSHTRFVNDWDIKLIDGIKTLESKGIKKPVISHYPHDINSKDIVSQNSVPRICRAFFHPNNGIPSFEGAQDGDTNGEFLNSAFVTGGMFFCRGLFLNEIPYDSRLDYLFVGEEILHSARFYTHGWDIFNPKENIVYHEYTRSSKPKIWNDINFDYLQKQSEKKVEMYLNLNNPELDEYHKQDFSRFGLGNERTLQEYYDFSGIDPETKTINKDFCGNTLKSNRKVYKRKIPTYIKILASILLIILLIVIINNVYKWNIGRI